MSGYVTTEAGKVTPVTRLRALVIGIDRYQSPKIKPLTGAVADANAIYHYLRTNLQVPDSQIKVLRNEEAKRTDILRELRALGTRSGSRARTFRQDDPLFIFFAGHGTTATTHSDCPTSSGKISLIVPHDSMFVDDFNVRDIRGYPHRVYPIPDRTIGALLHELAKACGNNITVILDCCYSGSGTRDFDYTPELGFERGFSMDDDDEIPADLDKEYWSETPRGIDFAAGFGTSGSRSHVLLAACRESEKAHEANKCGRFTTELLYALRQITPIWTSYLDLRNSIRPIPGQTPQCEGYHADRTLFGAFVTNGGRTLYPVLKQGGRVMMKSGSVQGMIDGALFNIHRDSRATSPILAVMKALHVSDFHTELEPSSTFRGEIPLQCFAFLRHDARATPVLRVTIHRKYRRGTILGTLQREIREGRAPYAIALDDSHPHLALDFQDSHTVVYTIRHDTIRNHGHERLSKTTRAERAHIYNVLRAASHFFWHLSRVPQYHQLRAQVRVTVHQLYQDVNGELDMNLRPPYVPSRNSRVMESGTTLNVVADNTTVYGIRVTNLFDEDLHIWVFYFDCSDLSIMDYYQPLARGHGADPSLPKNGELTIGFGAGGGQPFKYYLHPDQKTDLGIIKIFLSTEPIDLSGILQKSPFDVHEDNARATAKEPRSPPLKRWDTYQFIVKQNSA
ncbi:hypothetical protein PENSPDRAFT_754512 [Peniophora sp. CONT]|nr:hypothetical protein PENSPDRAFT_754512 [Peniophora sp. CONT]